ncbi:MAG: glycoside hydrolase family 3 C-terminal domain-containing protein [Deltaproteobacteria bacterium]
MEHRIQRLLEQLTIEEKLLLLGGKPGKGGAQANSATFALERIGLPELRMADGPMGVHWWCDASTAYPALIAAAASWDPELWYRLGTALGRDCRARGVHILLAPGVNIYRGAFCGRNFEYAGEDPYLSSRFAVAYIRGVQDQGVAATVKHYAVNYAEYGRHTVSSDLDERTLHEVYLPAFKAAVCEAGSGALMTAYNLVNGVHCSEHPGLILDILKGAWQFDGVVMSDWLSTYSVADAANAGLDLEMPSAEMFTQQNLLGALERGEVALGTIDDKVRRILRLAACFGWLDHEQRDASIPYQDPTSRQVALELARSGSVLLKNDRGTLPLDLARIKRIAVLGPYAHPAVFGGGGSSYTPAHDAVSLLRGLQELCPQAEVLHAAGPDPNPQHGVFAASVFQSAHGAGLWGEYFDNDNLAGAPSATRLDEHIDFAWGVRPPAEGILVPRFSIRWTGALTPTHSGKHLLHTRSHDSEYRVWLDGRLVIDNASEVKNGPHRADLELEAGREYALKIEYRKTRFFSGMQFGWQASDGGAKEIAECVALARAADVAIVTAGWDHVSEAEGFDRDFAMNPEVEALLLAVAAAQPKTVVVLTAGGNLDMSRFIDRVPAVLHAFYPGEAGGQALAEILLGQVNPSGRLPATFEKRAEDRSSFGSYFDADGDQRVVLEDGIFTGYRHFDRSGIEPRFAFGFGLSYTTFRHAALSLSRERLGAGQSLELHVEVTNTGSRAGAEVVQVYVRDVACRVPRPEKELKGFARVLLEPGESKRAQVVLQEDAFKYYDPEQRRWVLEPGEFEVLVGASATDIRQRAKLVVA